MALRLCTIASGSSGNCIYVGTEKSGLLIDCGMSGKYVLNALDQIGIGHDQIKGIVVTHEHSDHISGVGILSRKLKIPIYANNYTWEGMEPTLGKIAVEHIKTIKQNEIMTIDDMELSIYQIPHDAADPSGVCIRHEGKQVAIATDLGYFSKEVFEAIKGSEMILLESNHDIEMLKVGSYPYYLKRRILGDKGHLSNEAAGQAVCQLAKHGVKKVVLGHLSRENNFPELALQTVKGIVDGEKIQIDLSVAPRNTIGEIIEI